MKYTGDPTAVYTQNASDDNADYPVSDVNPKGQRYSIHPKKDLEIEALSKSSAMLVRENHKALTKWTMDMKRQLLR